MSEQRVLFLNGKPISPLVLIDFSEEEGWVDILNHEKYAPPLNTEPNVFELNENEVEVEIDNLPVKRLYGKVEVTVLNVRDINKLEK